MGSCSRLPPFPDDVPTAPLLRLSYQKIAAADEHEIDRLFAASKDTGFFYLDLSGSADCQPLLENVNGLFDLADPLFNTSLEDKSKHLINYNTSTLSGYKEKGRSVVDDRGNRDWSEFINITKNDIMETTKAIPAPQLLNDQQEMLQSYVRDSHSILILLLNRLNDHLGLPPDTLANMHRFECQSGDQIRFIKAHSLDQTADSQNAVGAHRDAGTITLLFNRLGGLQILPPGAGAEWCYVRPIPGHAIVNLGDSMVTFTNGLLRSNPHRVVAPPGAQAGHVRYSLVYFMRPDHEAVIRRLEGSELIPPLADGEVEQELSGKEWTKWRLTSIVNNEGMIKDAKHR